ncbi:MAG: plasmid stabilization system [Leptolyngbya sp. RL_3_1]|nr:plasmid stabilization system [Leptolyngbya sp. RL_3_1]
MIWRVRYAKTFYKELAKLPEKTRSQVETFVFDEAIKDNPFATGRIEKLVGYDDFYQDLRSHDCWRYR